MMTLFGVLLALFYLLQPMLATTEPLVSNPIQIIAFHNETFRVVEESLELLLRVDEPVTVCGVAGPGKSGKSYMLNAFSNQTNGFQVGAGLEPQTQGLWLLDSGLRGSDGSRLLLLDSQGLFELGATKQGDSKLFAMSALLSSHLLYNSQKTIDYNNLLMLEELVRRLEFFRDNTNVTSDAHDIVLKDVSLPTLTLVVQGFTQKLNNQTCTEYMQRFNVGKYQSTSQNLEGVHKMFRSFDCLTLAVPHSNEIILQDLSQAPLEDMTQSYQRDLTSLRSHVTSLATSKTISGNQMKGPQIVTLLRLLVLVIDRFPSAPSAAQSFVSNLISDTRDHLQGVALRRLGGLFSNPPANMSVFDSQALAIASETSDMFATQLTGIKIGDSTLTEFSRALSLEVMNATTTNKQLVESHIDSFLNTAWETATSKITSQALPVPKADLETSTAVVGQIFTLPALVDLSAYNQSQAYLQRVQQYEKQYAEWNAETIAKNDAAINTHLEAASKALTDLCQSVVSGYDSEIKFSQTLIVMHEGLLQIASAPYESIISQNIPWMSGSTELEQYHKQTQSQCSDFFTAYSRSNSDNITSVLVAAAERVKGELDKYVREELVVPDTDEAVQSQLASKTSLLLQTYLDETQWLSQAESYAPHVQSLNNSIAEIRTSTSEVNKHALDSGSKEAFACLQTKMRKQDCVLNATCLHNWIPAQFIKHVTAIATECIHASNDTQKMSEGLKNFVVEQWITSKFVEQYNVGISHRVTGLLVSLIALTLAAFIRLQR